VRRDCLMRAQQAPRSPRPAAWRPVGEGAGSAVALFLSVIPTEAEGPRIFFRRLWIAKMRRPCGRRPRLFCLAKHARRSELPMHGLVGWMAAIQEES
jgi:hypothetical protein